jgi:hypothetical protein
MLLGDGFSAGGVPSLVQSYNAVTAAEPHGAVVPPPLLSSSSSSSSTAVQLSTTARLAFEADIFASVGVATSRIVESVIQLIGDVDIFSNEIEQEWSRRLPVMLEHAIAETLHKHRTGAIMPQSMGVLEAIERHLNKSQEPRQLLIESLIAVSENTVLDAGNITDKESIFQSLREELRHHFHAVSTVLLVSEQEQQVKTGWSRYRYAGICGGFYIYISIL